MGLKVAQQALGLYRTPNQLGVAQAGAYVRLDECVIRSKDIVEPRLGHSLLSTFIGANVNDVRRFASTFMSSVGLLGQYGSGSASGIKQIDGTTEVLTDVDPPSPWVRNRFADCQKRCYVTTSKGLKRIHSDLTGHAAGGLEAKIDTDNSHPIYAASGFQPAGSACRYRSALVSFAPDGAEIVGPGSNPFVMRVAPDMNISISAMNRAANVISCATDSAHNLRPGDAPEFTFAAGDTGAGKFTTGTYVIATVPSATTFTIADVGAGYTNSAAVTLAAGPASGSVRVRLPSTATVADVVRLWRSEVQTVSVHAVPPDDVYEVFEAYLTVANISAGYVVISDNTPEVLLGNPSYFSPSVEGESGNNLPPPLAWDVCAVGEQIFLGNLTFKHQLEVRLLSSAMTPAQGLTFERAGYPTLELKSTYGPVTDEYFIMYNGGTVARDIEATAISICCAINAMASNTWLDAYYISAANDAPGMMLFKVRDFVATAFTVKDATSPTFWAPNLPSSGTVATSKQETDVSGVIGSKVGKPDAFPGGNRERAGNSSEKVLRILAVREKAIILKSESAWLGTPNGGGLRIDLLDNTCGFHLPDTAVVLDNQVFTLSSIGVVAVSESGVALMGSPIEGDTRLVSEQAARTESLLALGYTPHCLASWGAADELEHRYLLAIPSKLGTPAASPTTEPLVDMVWVFNAGSKVWSGPWRGHWKHASRWNSAASSSRLVFARHDRPAVVKEQGLDAQAAVRHADYFGQTLYVSAISGNDVTLKNSATGITTTGSLQVGDALYISATGFAAKVVGVGATSVTVDDASGLSATATARVLKGYEHVVGWVPMVGDAAALDKRLGDIVLSLSEERFRKATVSVSSDLDGRELEAKELSRPGFGFDMVRNSKGEMADAGFGNEKFGHSAPLRRERAQPPSETARGGSHSIVFRCREAGAFWKLHALSLETDGQGIKGVR